MNCSKCGTQLPKGVKFCNVCGSEIVKKEKSGTKKSGNKFVKGLLSVLCCILIFVMALSAITLASLRESLEEEKIESLIDNIDIDEVVKHVDVNEFVRSDITSKEIAKIYKKGNFDKFVKSTLEDYAEYILGGDTPDGVSGEDVVSLVQDNHYLIAEVSGYELTKRDYEGIQNYFDENGEDDLGFLSSEVRTDGILKTVRVLGSVHILIALIVIALLFAVLLLKIRKSYDITIWTGITLIISAVLFGVFGAIRPIVLGILSGCEDIVIEGVRLYMSNILSTVLKNTVITILVGVILICVYVLIKKFKKRRVDKNVVNEEKEKTFCPQCGEPLEEKTVFCSKCGTKVNDVVRSID